MDNSPSAADFDALTLRLHEAATLSALADAWDALIAWIAAGDPGVHAERLAQGLESDAGLRAAIGGTLGRLVAATDARDLLASVGMSSSRGFLAEAGRRLATRILPPLREDRDLDHHWRRWFRDGALLDRIQGLPPRTAQRLLRALGAALPESAWAPLRAAAADALRLLAVRIQAEGLTPNMRSRSHRRPVDASPFFRLASAVLAAADAWAGGGVPDAGVVEAALADCRAEIGEVHRQMQEGGVSVDLVFSLDVLQRCGERLSLLLAVGAAADPLHRGSAIARLLICLARSAHEERSLRHLAGDNLRLLHQRIVERAGRTGEHYIARNRREYAHSWLAAAGGGVLTTGTAAMKVTVTGLHVAAAAHGLLSGLNYAASFIALQHCHLILATKQPAMTAAALAGIMRQSSGADRLDRLVDVTARIVHSQLAAAIANVAVVAAGAFAFDSLWRLASGHHFIDAPKAAAIYASLSPVDSLTVFYAALTGVILWLSSLAGGWVDNAAALHRLPQALREHHLGLRFGRDRLLRLGDAVERHLGGWATNLSLGMMLGFTPVIGEFLGLPLDVRHVTLNSGILALACAGHADWWGGGFFLLTLSGIGVMFILNLGVSFGLSLFTALRAYELPPGELAALGRRLLARLLTRPQDFLWPWRDPRPA